MELRFVVPNMEKTFGNLEFAGENTTEQQRINGRMAVITRSYNLYSDVQRADDVVVVLPAKAGEKHFSPEQKVKLINPRITTDGYLQVKAQTHRTQLSNKQEAAEKINNLLQKALEKKKARIATKASKASKERRIESKKKTSEIKAGRQKLKW